MAVDPNIVSARLAEMVKEYQSAKNRKELKLLPDALMADERLLAVTCAMMGADTGLLTLTDHRPIWLSQGLISSLKQREFHLKQIRSVSHKIGLLAGDISLDLGGGQEAFKNIFKTETAKFAAALTQALHQPSEPSAACPGCADPTSPPEPQATPDQPPNASRPQPKKTGCLAKGLMILGGVALFLFVIGLFFAPETPQQPTSTQTTVVVTQKTPAPEPAPQAPVPAPAPVAPGKTFGFTIDRLIANYNQIAPTLKCVPLSKSNAKRQDGPAASATILSTEYISIVIQSPLGSDQVANAIYIGVGDGTERSGLLITLSAMCFVAAMTPELDGESRGQVLQELGLMPVAVTDGLKREWQDRRIRLTSQFSDVTGLNVTADTVK